MMTASKPHAEIAGGGIAGLMMACVLGKRGWSVRLHERGSELREIGAGLFLKENGILALKEIGAFTRLEPCMVRIKEGKVFNEKKRVLLHRITELEQNYTVLRGELHRVLVKIATELGTEIITSSPVAGAEPEGTLILESGQRLKADLVIGADGHRSRVRDSLNLATRLRVLREGAIRLLVTRSEREAYPMQQEHWCGRYRVGFAPCSPTEVYIFLMGPLDDPMAAALPVNREFWLRHFPHLEPLLRRIDNAEGTHQPLVMVDVRTWRTGRVAILGDAAHAQPPNLGQGAGLAISNAMALGEHLDAVSSVDDALANWEAARRPVSELVKTWSYRYGQITGEWPLFALPLRSALVWTLGHMPVTAKKWAWLWRGGMERGLYA
jgi:2-polyprenyl-6-methoxyphenol hydroxylase-like FAD-dependent oxidoreductase